MPPEVEGMINHAVRHARIAEDVRWRRRLNGFRRREMERRHREKVQRLCSKANKYLTNRGT